MNGYLVWLCTSFIVGLVCAAIAKKYGKDPYRWFIIGAALNVLALVVITNAKKIKKPLGSKS